MRNIVGHMAEDHMKLHVYDGLWVQKMQLTNLFQFNFTLNNSYLNDGIFIYFKK